ncbi:hypothetical protein EIK77_003171 [Talaromyces pinophilus]|nr:hypothetical protein EIK77_003171 [Talaromyces pinophilus]PCG92709.1 Hypothetical protein PENO1_087390 [Penicillium occitanis (nom. inval.)]PCG92973.1 hypothetical protein PENOC_090030 [Penicillium occitanis (nom. inval.)]
MTPITLEEVKEFLQLEEDGWNRLDRLVTKILDDHTISPLSGRNADSWYLRNVFPALRDFNANVFRELGEVVDDDQTNEITAAVRKLVTVKKRNRKCRVQPARHSPSSPAKQALGRNTAANTIDVLSIPDETEENDNSSVDENPRDDLVQKKTKAMI